MNTSHDLAENPIVLQIAQDYLAELEAGRTPARESYLALHPDLAEGIAECLDGIDMLFAAGRNLAPVMKPIAVEPNTEPLGDFRIVREIGRGGMGVVYEAVQLSLGRRVALKVLPFAASLDARQLQRFRTEAQAAAQLHHTNIVAVYAVGCERGMHFYAMQLIDGRPLDSVIRELREHDSSSPSLGSTVELQAGRTVMGSAISASQTRRSRADFNTVAKLTMQVAEALDYAHQAGVIHRDIKPANLLLDDKGTVWVTDFGLAQIAAAEVGLTQTGDLVGTLRYMSPEQAAGQRGLVDHRTDIYSLGATLYELLALRPIFPAEDRLTLFRQILHDDPQPLRAINRRIPVELETIVMKAVAKSPGDRYATASDFAADLRRFLDDRPILARRPTLADRARKWARRHPTILGASIVFLILGLIGMGVATALILQEQKLTQQAYQREKLRSQEAEQRFQLARRSADKLFQLAQEETADQPQLEGTRKRLLETALGYYQELIELRSDDPSAQADLAAVRDQVKQILADLAVMQGDRHLMLLGENDVRADLTLTPEQYKRLDEHLREMQTGRDEMFRDFRSMGSEERSRRFLELARTNEAGVAAILTSDQVHRLKQIALQMRGPGAFRDSEVIAKLQLTPEQRDRLRIAELGDFQPRDGGRRGMSGPPGFDPKPAVNRMLAVLTPQQQTAWRELVGEPYLGRTPFHGPPRNPNDRPPIRPNPPNPRGPDPIIIR